jgi:phosphoglucosamine mutase
LAKSSKTGKKSKSGITSKKTIIAKPKAPGKMAGKVEPPKSSLAAPRLFGTDGIRTVAGEDALSPGNILRLGRALGRYLCGFTKGNERPVVLLGVDPRPSADYVGTTLCAGLIAECCDVHWPGMMSTPEVAFCTKHGPFAAGIAVTASHNPANDNGIKILAKDGGKIPDVVERELERAVAQDGASTNAQPTKGRFGWLQLSRERHYEEFIAGTFRASFANLAKKPLRVVFDCAFGARSIDLQVVSRLAKSVAMGRTLPQLRTGMPMNTSGDNAKNALDIFYLNTASPSNPDTHHLINAGVGSLHPQSCAAAVKELQADLGVCFDGDGDRCILVDENGEIRDGDYMLALLAKDLKEAGKLKGNTVVSTTMANFGLEEALRKDGIKLIRTEVGDRYVREAMKSGGFVLGGEPSGHLIIADEQHDIGDGLYTALRVIEIMLDSSSKLSALSAALSKYPQVIRNVRVTHKPELTSLRHVVEARRAAEKKLGDQGRIIVRYSGTEPLLRIMVEGRNQALVNSVTDALEAAAKKELG